MSLLDDAFEPCVFMNAAKQPDGYGGYTTVWTEGAEFSAAIVYNDSLQAKIAQKDGVTSLYTVTTRKSLTLDFHDVFKRIRDGLILRVTSNGTDNRTPASAGLDMRQVSAEQYTLAY